MTSTAPPQASLSLTIEQILQQSIAHHQAGRLQEADTLYQSILQLQPLHPEANHNMGVLAVEMKQLTIALPYFLAALEAEPAHGTYWLSYINALIQADQSDAAREVLAIALQQGLEGDEIEALALLLNGDTQVAEPANAENCYSLEDSPDAASTNSQNSIKKSKGHSSKIGTSSTHKKKNPSPHEINKLLVLYNKGRYSEAIALAHTMTDRYPNHEFGWKVLGAAFRQTGRNADALAAMQKVAELSPNDFEAHNDLGVALKGFGRLEEAEASYRRALQIKPNIAAIHGNLGNALKDLGRLEEAEASFLRALQIKPEYAEAHSSLGNTLSELGRLAEAEVNLRCALQIKPDYAEAHNNLGVVFQGLGQLGEAESSYRRALQINPDMAETYSNLGNTLNEMGRLDEAEVSLRQALKINPDYAEVHSNLGATLLNLGRLSEAEASYRRALQIKPDYALAYSSMLFCLSNNKGLEAQALFAEHARFGKQFEAPLRNSWPQHENSRNPERCLQIGIVSGDLCSHAMASFIEQLLIHLSAYQQLSLHAYANHEQDDSTSLRLREYFKHWHPIVGLSDAALAEKIRADGIDILVDLSGHTAKNRLLTFARKPAPVQASWMGYPGTTGLNAMDYYLADRFFLPPGQFDSQFTEKIVQMPANAPFLPFEGAPSVNALPALTNGHITFGSFNRLNKISQSVIMLWAQLLRALPDSHMLMGGMPEEGKYDTLINWFAQEGIARERLVFYPRSGMNNYLSLHHHVDFCLDTFPYNGGTTTMHALWMGVPTLTMAGSTAAGRPGASILGHVDLEAFVAHGAADFVQKGLYWADNLAALSDVRAGLRERFAKSAIGQPAVVAAGVERALRIMWQRWCAGLPAESFEVSQSEPKSVANMSVNLPTQEAASYAIEQTMHQAIAHHQAGQLQEAEMLYRAILQIQPHHAEANHNMGVVATETNQIAAALPYFLAAVEDDPAQGSYWTSYIGALIQAEQFDAASEVLAIALQHGLRGNEVEEFAAFLDGELTAQTDKPSTHNESEPAPHEMNTLLKLFSEGRYTEVETLAQTMTVQYPLHGLSWKVLGAAFKHMGNNAAALLPMQKAAALMPDDAESHGNLGMAFKDMGQINEAEISFRRATEINADFAEAHHNLGETLKELGRLDEAEASFRHALQIKHDYAVAHFDLGNTLQSLGRLDETEACYLRALQINPDYAEAHNNLGATYVDHGRLKEAEASFRRALEINPQLAAAHYNLGNTLKDMRRFVEAETSYRRAIKIKPDYAEAYNNMGTALQDMGRLDEARDSYRMAHQFGFYGAHIKEALMLPAIMGTRQEVLESRSRFERNLDKLIADKVAFDDPLTNVGNTNFYLAYHGLNDRDLQVKVAKHYEQACPSLLYTAPHCIKPESTAQNKIRVGFLSRFLHSHSVSLCFSKIIETLTLNGQFEVTLISSHPIDEKVYSEFEGNCVRLPYHLVQAREMLAALELDILVYLDIGMEPLSYFLAFSRLARTQCVLAGHPVTTGIANMDYFLSADPMEPLDAEAHYSEKLVRLPRPLAYFTRPILPAIFKTRLELKLPSGRHIYTCPMKLQKLHPDFDEAITRILQIDENGVVVLFEDDMWPYWKPALMKRLDRTIPVEIRDRIIFLPWLKDPTDFISLIATSDVVLDPFHFGIGSTSAFTSVTGTPLVTKPGEFMRGKVGEAYCKMLEVTECIAEDTERYAQKAVEIANDSLLREKISAKILKNNFVLYENMQPIEDFVNFLHSLSDNGHTA